MHSYADPNTPVADPATLLPTAQAAALGYSAALFGYPPAQGGYCREPGLPWLTADMLDSMPLGYTGFKTLPHYCEFGGNDMAPRFEKKNLVIGRVYAYAYRNPETGEREYQAGRLETIGGNCLWARADNNPAVGLCWLLNEQEPHKAVGDVYEITHYVSYPEEQEGGQPRG